jgi:hypothetical protein
MVIAEYGRGTYGRETYSPDFEDDVDKDVFFEEDMLTEAEPAETALTPEDEALSQELSQLTTDPTAGAPAPETLPTDAAPVEPMSSGTTEAPVETPMEPTDSDEVEVDVTDIVSGVESTETSVKNIEQKVDGIGSEVNTYIEKLMKANEVLMSKVGELEKNMKDELIKRNPTPQEQIMLRSMSSAPYTQKLSDYWSDTGNGGFVPTKQMSQTSNSKEEDETPKEYTLTQKEIDDDFNNVDIRKTF